MPAPQNRLDLIQSLAVLTGLAATGDVRQSWRRVAQAASDMCDSATSVVTLLDPSRQSLDFVAAHGPRSAEIVGQRIGVQDSLTGATALHGVVRVVHNDSSRSDGGPGAFSVQSAVVVPIMLDGHSVGALAVSDKASEGAFTDDDVQALTSLAAVVAVSLKLDAMQVQHLQSELERAAIQSTAQATTPHSSIQDVLAGLLHTLSQCVNATWGVVLLYNDTKSTLSPAATHNLGPEAQSWSLDSGSVRTRELLAVRGCCFHLGADILAQLAPNLDDVVGLISDELAVATCPMTTQQGTIGLIVLGVRSRASIAVRDTELIQTVAAQAAVILENALLHDDAARRSRESDLLFDLSQKLNSALSQEECWAAVQHAAARLLQVDQVQCFLHDERRTGLAPCSVGRSPGSIEPAVSSTSTGFAGWIYSHGSPLAVTDLRGDSRRHDSPYFSAATESAAGVPLQINEEIGGVLCVTTSVTRQFTVADMELLYTIGLQAGLALTKALLYAKARNDAERLQHIVKRLSTTFSAGGDVAQAAQGLVDLANDIFGGKKSVVYIVSDLDGLTPYAWSGGSRGAGWSTRGSGAAASVAKGRMIGVQDLLTQQQYAVPPFARREVLDASIAVPLKYGRRVIGVIEVYDRGRVVTTQDARLLASLARQAALGIQNSLLLSGAARRVDDLNVIRRISDRVGAVQDVRKLCHEMLALLCEGTSSEVAMAVLADDAAGPVIYRAAAGAGAVASAESIAALTEAVHRWLSSDEVPKASTGEMAASDGRTMAAPIVEHASGRLLGALVVSNVSHSDIFDNDDKRLLATSANILAIRLSGSLQGVVEKAEAGQG